MIKNKINKKIQDSQQGVNLIIDEKLEIKYIDKIRKENLKKILILNMKDKEVYPIHKKNILENMQTTGA